MAKQNQDGTAAEAPVENKEPKKLVYRLKDGKESIVLAQTGIAVNNKFLNEDSNIIRVLKAHKLFDKLVEIV